MVLIVWYHRRGQRHFRKFSVPINSNNSVPYVKGWNKNGHVDIYTLNNPIRTLACLWLKKSSARNLGYGRDAECWKQKECRQRLVPPPALLSGWLSLGNFTGFVFYICKVGILIPDSKSWWEDGGTWRSRVFSKEYGRHVIGVPWYPQMNILSEYGSLPILCG